MKTKKLKLLIKEDSRYFHVHIIKLVYIISVILILLPNIFSILDIKHNNPNSNVNYEKLTPTSSGLTYDFNITLTSLNPTSAYHGQSVTLYGNAKRWNYGSSSWENAVGEIIYLIVDNQPRYNRNGTVNSAGNFQISFIVENNWNIFKNIIISANVSNPNRTAITWFPQELDVNAYTTIIIEDNNLPALRYTTKPHPTFTNYRLSSRLDLLNGSTYSGPTVGLNLNYGSGSTTVYTDPQGRCNYNFYWSGESSYIWSFSGNDNLSSATPVSGYYKEFKGIEIDFLDTASVAYQTYNFFIRGKLILKEYGELDRSSIGVRINFVNESVYATCNVNGVFSANIMIPSGYIGLQDLEVKIETYNGENVYESNLQNPSIISYKRSFEVKAPTMFDNPNSFSSILIIIIAIIAGGIIGLIVFMRYKFKKEAIRDKLNMIASIEEKLSYIRLLIEAGRSKEGIGYLWLIYSQMASTYFNIEKSPSQTPKDFAILLVREYGQNPASLYPFIQKIEEAVYGNTPITEEYLNEVIKMFRRVYLELTGSMLTKNI